MNVKNVFLGDIFHLKASFRTTAQYLMVKMVQHGSIFSTHRVFSRAAEEKRSACSHLLLEAIGFSLPEKKKELLSYIISSV